MANKKCFKTFNEQLSLLESRGLRISNKEAALKILERENYYRLVNGNKDFLIEKQPENEHYRNGSTFEELLALHTFDKELRIHLLPYLLQVENHIKSLIAYRLSETYGESGYCMNESYNMAYRSEKILKIQAHYAKAMYEQYNKKTRITHYIKDVKEMPLWVLITVLTFGIVSEIYSCMHVADQEYIANHFPNVSDYGELRQDLWLLSLLRNSCAHEERLYFTRWGKAKAKKSKYHDKLLTNGEGVDDLFAAIIALKKLLEPTEFACMTNAIGISLDRLSKVLKSISINEVMNNLGFPNNWIDLVEL